MSDTHKTLNEVLSERGSRYGKFEEHAIIAMAIKDIFRTTLNWHTRLADDQCQALDTIADKIARILNGDPNYDDNWRDIAGYATLVLNRLINK